MAQFDGTISYGGIKVLTKNTDLEKGTLITDGNMLMSAVRGSAPSDLLRASVPFDELRNKKFALEHGDAIYIVKIASIEHEGTGTAYCHAVKFSIAYSPPPACDTGG